MIVKPKDALEDARTTVDYDAGQGAAYAEIAQAEQLTRLADLVEELVVVVRIGFGVRS
jgi:hypothetical protein